MDTIIKQSQLLGLLKKIGDALEEHSEIDRLTQQLRAELNVHKEAQKIVNELMSPEGDASLVLAELQLAVEDTSPDIRDGGARLISDHQNFLERKNRVRGADFPELVNRLNQLIVYSESLIKEHRSQMRELIASYDAYYQSIDSLSQDLEVYINYIPNFDNQSIKLFGEALEESISILDEEKVEKYSWLRPAVNKMQTEG